MDSILHQISCPADLKPLTIADLNRLSDELRQFIIDAVSVNPSHLGSSLGVVELTLALHYVYEAPLDKIIWDVGHQAYGHKILTGRRSLFHTNRKYRGISGFPRRNESEYDVFGTGHASTSISAALGMDIAMREKQPRPHVVAVIGDGALTGGMAFEGLNHAGIQNSNLLVILNDNHMAIDPSVGALKHYLPEMTAAVSSLENRRKDFAIILESLKKQGEAAREMAQRLEDMLMPVLEKQSNFFEALQFQYFGPVNGHSIEELVRALTSIKDLPGPKILHVLTTKGKGFKQAEQNQTEWHHPPAKFNSQTGEMLISSNQNPHPPRFQEVFGHTLLELARLDERIVGITPAMPSGSSMNILMEAMPDRAFDVGIAEQHAVTFSAGLALEGKIPFCNIYSTFLQRAYDQLIHDVALQEIPVVFCLDRAGLVGADGATHHGSFDLALCRTIPNLIIASPLNEHELRNLLFSAWQYREAPFVIRYPRGRGSLLDWRNEFEFREPGKGSVLREGKRIVVLSIGPVGVEAMEVIDSLSEVYGPIALFDMRYLKPIDEDLLHRAYREFDAILTIEDGSIKGGLGSAVLEFASDHHYAKPLKRLGIPDYFVEQGSPEELRAECGFDAAGIRKALVELFQLLED